MNDLILLKDKFFNNAFETSLKNEVFLFVADSGIIWIEVFGKKTTGYGVHGKKMMVKALPYYKK